MDAELFLSTILEKLRNGNVSTLPVIAGGKFRWKDFQRDILGLQYTDQEAYDKFKNDSRFITEFTNGILLIRAVDGHIEDLRRIIDSQIKMVEAKIEDLPIYLYYRIYRSDIHERIGSGDGNIRTTKMGALQLVTNKPEMGCQIDVKKCLQDNIKFYYKSNNRNTFYTYGKEYNSTLDRKYYETFNNQKWGDVVDSK